MEPMEDQASFIAGVCAGFTEHTLLYPLDNWKTHLQTDCKWRPSSIASMYSGYRYVLASVVPSHGVYYMAYTRAKEWWGDHAFGWWASGCSAVFCHDVISVPLDTLKQRYQLGQRQTSSFRTSYRQLYRSLPLTLLMNIPQVSFNVITYETVLRTLDPNGQRSESAAIILTASAMAGMLSGFCTTPLDQWKTRLQTQTQMTNTISAYLSWKGAVPRTLYMGLGSALSWSTFEFVHARWKPKHLTSHARDW